MQKLFGSHYLTGP